MVTCNYAHHDTGDIQLVIHAHPQVIQFVKFLYIKISNQMPILFSNYVASYFVQVNLITIIYVASYIIQ